MPIVALKPPAGQHMEALARANTIRLARARLRRDVAIGRRAVADVIVAPPAEARTATIGDVLAWQHCWGRTRVTRFLALLQTRRVVFISESRPLEALTQRERHHLAAVLRGDRIDRAWDGRHVDYDDMAASPSRRLA